MNFNVRFWGTRGSIATPGSKTQRYGGNTSCVEVTADDTVLIFDAGTGLRELGTDLLARAPHGVEAHLFLSHTHWDHIQGFPFFAVPYRESTQLTVYETNPNAAHAKNALFEQMRPGFFPITPEAFLGEIRTAYFEGNTVQIDDTLLHYAEQSHPGRSFGYRIEHRDRRVVYATDNELDVFLETPHLVREHPERLRTLARHVEDFVREADLLIAEAQYTDDEYEPRVGWGHARISTVVDLAVSAKVRRLALFHHDPQHSDDEIDHLVELARARAQSHGSRLEIFAAAEGATLDLAL